MNSKNVVITELVSGKNAVDIWPPSMKKETGGVAVAKLPNVFKIGLTSCSIFCRTVSMVNVIEIININCNISFLIL